MNARMNGSERRKRMAEPREQRGAPAECRQQLAPKREPGSGEGSGRSCQRVGVSARAVADRGGGALILQAEVRQGKRGCGDGRPATAAAVAAAPARAPAGLRWR